jgi:hypothetical protein
VSRKGTAIEDFGVLKVHKLSERTVVGFAGSVAIGFSEVNRLQQCARRLGTRAEVPEILAAWYPEAIAGYVRRYPEEQRSDGCDLVMVGVSEKKLLTEDGKEIGPWDTTLSSWHLTHGSIIRFPTPTTPGSDPEPLGNFGASIGCGARVAPYVDSIRENVAPAILKMLDIGPAATSASATHIILSLAFSAAVQATPMAGVAAKFVGAVVRPEGVFFGTSDYGTMGSGPLPPLASSSAELRKLAQRFRVSASGYQALADVRKVRESAMPTACL